MLEKNNLTMFVDFYELTMSNVYLKNGLKDQKSIF